MVKLSGAQNTVVALALVKAPEPVRKAQPATNIEPVKESMK